MTSTIKRRIARELLIFLLCAVIGLFIAYYVLYFHQRHYIPNLNDYHGWIYIQDEGVNAIPYRYETPVTCSGDLIQRRWSEILAVHSDSIFCIVFRALDSSGW